MRFSPVTPRRSKSNEIFPPPPSPSPSLSLLFSPSSQRRVYLARTYTISGPYIGARELARSGIRARVRTQNASRCARRKITKVYSANAAARHSDACARVSVQVADVCTIYDICRHADLARTRRPAGVGAVLQSDDNDRAVQGNRLHALKIRPSMPNVEEELANAPAGQKLFRSLLS